MGGMVVTPQAPYSEGVYSATVVPATLGDWSPAYTNQAGVWTRVGRLVFVDVALVFTPTFGGTATGQLRFSLPFTAANPQNSTGFSISEIGANFSWPASRTALALKAIQGAAYCVLSGIGTANNPTDFAPSNLTTGVSTILRFSGVYRV